MRRLEIPDVRLGHRPERMRARHGGEAAALPVPIDRVADGGAPGTGAPRHATPGTQPRCAAAGRESNQVSGSTGGCGAGGCRSIS